MLVSEIYPKKERDTQRLHVALSYTEQKVSTDVPSVNENVNEYLSEAFHVKNIEPMPIGVGEKKSIVPITKRCRP